MKNYIILALLVITSFSLFAQEAEEYQLTGEQIKKEDGQIRLKCNAINLDHQVSIKKVEGSDAGFWISGKKGKIQEFQDKSDAVDFAMAPGIYWIYPHLEQNKKRAKVTVTFRRD